MMWAIVIACALVYSWVLACALFPTRTEPDLSCGFCGGRSGLEPNGLVCPICLVEPKGGLMHGPVTLNDVTASVIKRGHSHSDKTQFRATARRPIDRADATALQVALGFHPQGYGGPDGFVCVDDGDAHIARWCCSGSCD